MTHGKTICKQLKEVRKRIAEENDIPLEIEECTYKGECRGTCPRCEAEVRYLENALADRLRIGKVATVAGLALGLAATAQAQAPETAALPNTVDDTRKENTLMSDSVRVRGIVRDNETGEEIPFCIVQLWDEGRHEFVYTRELNNGMRGSFSIPVPKGKYLLIISHIGYLEWRREVALEEEKDLGEIIMQKERVITVRVGGIEPVHIDIPPAGHEEYYQGTDRTTIIVR